MIRMGMKIVAADGTLTREGYEMLMDLQRDFAAAQGKIAAAAAVAAPTGGATIDAQARAAINAIRAALA